MYMNIYAAEEYYNKCYFYGRNDELLINDECQNNLF